jgi:hypothetical protein
MKKIIVVFVNNSMAELDWLMPILDRLSKDYKIFTYFRNKKSYDSLRQNIALYKAWKKINTFIFVERSFNNLLFKVLKKTSFFFGFRELGYYLNNIINDIRIIKNIIEKEITLDKYKIKIIFSDLQENFLFLENFKKIKNRPLIVHYPHSPMAYVKRKNYTRKVRLCGDVLLVGRKNDIPFFEKSIHKKKIISVGTPKFDSWWIKKTFLSYKNKLDFGYTLKDIKKKFIITIAYDSKFAEKRFKKKINLMNNQLKDLMDIVSKISNVLIIFKIHPRRNSNKFKYILNQYNKNIWVVSKMHLSQLVNFSDCFISVPSSAAGYEALTFKVPLIALPEISGVDSTNTSNSTLNLIEIAKDKNDLSRLINLSKNKRNKLWQAQQKKFNFNYPNKDNASIEALKIIKKEQKKLSDISYIL